MAAGDDRQPDATAAGRKRRAIAAVSQIRRDALSSATLQLMQRYFTDYLENILGLKGESAGDDQKLTGVMELLIDIRRDARSRKDYSTSDKIRNQLLQLGIVLKDEKDGGVSYTFA